MKVLYEPETFSIQDYGGVSRYFYELIHHAGPGLTCDLPVVLSNNLYLRDREHTRHRQFLPGLPVRGRWRVMQYFNRRAARRAIARQDYDVLHPTGNDQAYFLDIMGDKPLVITIHDMISTLFSEYFQSRGPELGLLAARAARIITVSEHTRADVLRLLPVRPERVVVVHHGHVVHHNSSPVPVAAPDDYLLFTGTRRDYKNFGCLVKAFGLLHQQYPGLHLMCAGGGPFSEAELVMLREAGVAKRTHQLGYLTDDQLNQLYHRARAFVFPSLYEGFGFPILEAFGQQCPVVLSNASCFPEIAQDAAQYFDPYDADDLREQLDRVLCDRALRHTLVNRALTRVRDFTWERAAAQTRQVYEEARQDALVLTPETQLFS
ncbi:glycosyltransferase family 4 protein [Hymenobacter siberiensis]|uniref:glycosyltransferase family 4 protein n=1 Tax=Hymenobacter siberiensis TaxID=2848396 RepID=UPI001C1E5811|nr:glycosyltransferase family 1 protein [Hymenobacter siberiensis]